MNNNNTQKILDEFFKNLMEFGDKLSREDVDVAVDSLQIAFEDLKLMKREAVQKRGGTRKARRGTKTQKERKIRKQKEHIDSFMTNKVWFVFNNSLTGY